MSSFIIIIFFLSNNIFYIAREKPAVIKYNKIVKILYMMAIIIYCAGLSVPICCEKKFKSKILDTATKVIYHYNKYN